MEIGYIDKQNIEWFKPLMLDSSVRAIERGEPVIAFGAVEDKTAVGAVSGVVSHGDFVVDSFFVAPEYRNRGVGDALLAEVSECIKGRGITIDFSFEVFGDEQKTLVSFLTHRGFIDCSEDIDSAFVLNLSDVFSSPLFKNDRDISMPLFSEIPDIALKRASAYAQENDYIMPEGWFISPSIDRRISVMLLDEFVPKAYVTFEKLSENMIQMSSAFNGTGQPTIFIRMIAKAINEAGKYYPGDTQVIMQALNRTSLGLINHLFPKAERISYCLRK